MWLISHRQITEIQGYRPWIKAYILNYKTINCYEEINLWQWKSCVLLLKIVISPNSPSEINRTAALCCMTADVDCQCDLSILCCSSVLEVRLFKVELYERLIFIPLFNVADLKFILFIAKWKLAMWHQEAAKKGRSSVSYCLLKLALVLIH
jgi:hypothetical protein